MTGECFEVPPLSKKKIREVALEVRRAARQADAEKFPIIDLLELALPEGLEGYVFEVRERRDMEAEGLTYPDPPTIVLREDVYDGACAGNGRDRFTAAHEAGHLFLHPSAALARATNADEIPAYKSSEWQANQFAAELMMPVGIVAHMSGPIDVADRCCMSFQAAEIRWNSLVKEGLI